MKFYNIVIIYWDDGSIGTTKDEGDLPTFQLSNHGPITRYKFTDKKIRNRFYHKFRIKKGMTW